MQAPSHFSTPTIGARLALLDGGMNIIHDSGVGEWPALRSGAIQGGQAVGCTPEQTVNMPHASPQSACPSHAGAAAGSNLPKPQSLGLRQTVADSVASLVGLTPPGEAGQQSQAEAAASSMSTAAEARIGELAVVPPMLGISQRLLHRDHHKVYYEVGQPCCRLASRRSSRRGATPARKLGLRVPGWELRHFCGAHVCLQSRQLFCLEAWPSDGFWNEGVSDC